MTTKLSARLFAPAVVLAFVVVASGGCGDLHNDDVASETLAYINEIDTSPRGLVAGTGNSYDPFSVVRDNNVGISVYYGRPLMRAVTFFVHVDPNFTPWGYIRHDGVMSIPYIDTNGHVHELSSDTFGSNSRDTDLTTLGNCQAPIAKVGTASAPTPDVIGRPRMIRSLLGDSVVYIAADNHIIELQSGVDPGTYSANDITLYTGIAVKAGSAFPHTRADGFDAIDYIGTDNHIHELTTQHGGNWFDHDLHVASGETTIPQSSPWAYTRTDGYDCVVFEGSDHKVHEFAYKNGVQYYGTLPSAKVSTGLLGRPSGYVRHDSMNTVVYIANDDRQDPKKTSVHELSLQSSGWVDSTLPINVAAKERPQGQAFGLASPGMSSVFFRSNVPADGIVYSLGRELVLTSFGWTEWTF